MRSVAERIAVAFETAVRIVVILTPGSTADCTVGPACVSLLDGIEEIARRRSVRQQLVPQVSRKKGIRPAIPGRSNRKKRIRHDKQAYKARNVIERCYCRLKDFRLVAARYDKLARKRFIYSVPLPLLSCSGCS
jgi:transposase